MKEQLERLVKEWEEMRKSFMEMAIESRKGTDEGAEMLATGSQNSMAYCISTLNEVIEQMK